MTTSDQETKPRSYFLAFLWAVLAGAILCAFLFMMLMIVPRIEKDAAEQAMRLPLAMEWTIAISRWHVKYWYVVPPMIVAVCLGVGALVYLLQPQGRLRTGCWVLWLALFSISLGVLAFFVAWQFLAVP